MYFFSFFILSIIFLSLANYLVVLYGSVFYELKQKKIKKRKRKNTTLFLPKISVIIPAYNEEKTILRTIKAVYNSDYPKDNLEVILANDGSTDRTLELITDFKKEQNLDYLIYSQENAGKAEVLNQAIKLSTGEILIVVDSDSIPTKTALREIVLAFSNPKVAAVASNIRVRQNGKLLNFIQYFEYIIGWQSKRSSFTLGLDYILGGIGSAFRRSVFEEIGGYDSDTVVEDMDITFKLLRKKHKVAFSHNAVIYTEGAPTFSDLIRQRYRWKFGHTQVLWKHRDIFFSRKIHRRLSYFWLPFVAIREISVLFEPIVPLFVLFLFFSYGDWVTLIAGMAVVSITTSIQLSLEDTLSKRERFRLFLSAPAMYFLMYLINFVWFISLLKTILNLKELNKAKGNWKPVERVL